MKKTSLKERIQQWYEGEHIPYENDPDSLMVVIGGWHDRHWTARALRVLVEFYKREWKWLIPVVLTIIGLIIALIKI